MSNGFAAGRVDPIKAANEAAKRVNPMKTLPELAQQVLAELKAIDLSCLNHAGQYKAIERIEKAIAVVSEMAASESGPVDDTPVMLEVLGLSDSCKDQAAEDAYNAEDFKRDYPNGEPTRDSMHPQGM